MENNKVSILLLVRSLEVGGAERQLVALAQGLHERGHRVAVAVFYMRGPLDSELRAAGVPIIDLRKKGRWEILRFIGRLRHAIASFRPDIIYSFLGGANIAAASVRPFTTRAKLVWSIRASDMDLSYYDWSHRLSYWLERMLSLAPDLLIANSETGRDFAVANGFPRDRIEVVPNGIDVKRFRPDGALRQEQRAQWGLADDIIVIGVLARFDPMKGHADFLRASARIADARTNLRFVCVGSGSEEGALKALADELGIDQLVEFPGPSSNPQTVLNAFDIYCSSSLTEGFSNAIAEAMACGLPCVVTDVGDSARIVGDTGLTVPRSDPEALATAVIRLVDSDRRQLSAKARWRVLENFSLGAMIDRTISLIAS